MFGGKISSVIPRIVHEVVHEVLRVTAVFRTTKLLSTRCFDDNYIEKKKKPDEFPELFVFVISRRPPRRAAAPSGRGHDVIIQSIFYLYFYSYTRRRLFFLNRKKNRLRVVMEVVRTE